MKPKVDNVYYHGVYRVYKEGSDEFELSKICVLTDRVENPAELLETFTYYEKDGEYLMYIEDDYGNVVVDKSATKLWKQFLSLVRNEIITYDEVYQAFAHLNDEEA